MDAKTGTWVVICLMIVAFGAVVIYGIEREVSVNEVSKARTELASITTVRASRSAMVDQSLSKLVGHRTALAELQGLEERVGLLEVEKVSLFTERDLAESAWKSEKEQFALSIQKVRTINFEEPLAEVVLQSGVKLLSARLKDVKPDMVILEHSAGITRVAGKDLPDGVGERWAVDWNPVLETTVSLSGGKEFVETEQTADSEVEGPGIKDSEIESIDRKDSLRRVAIADLNLKLQRLRKSISDLTQVRQKHSTRASEFSSKSNSKSGMSSYGGLAKKENAAAEAISIQIGALEATATQVQQQIDEKQALFDAN
jgi:hypothetical protein